MSAQPVRRTRNARRSLPVGDAAVRLLLPVILVLAVLGGVVPAWGDGSAPPQIVPGVGIGPVRIGMTGTEAQEALALFEVESHQCTIDALISHDRVVALGTRYGGCLQLALPSSAIGAMAVGTMLLPEVGGIGGTPAPLVRAFGHPRRFVLDPGMAVLLWPNGLVARIAASRNYEIITYLAVVAPQTAIPPYAFLTALTPSN